MPNTRKDQLSLDHQKHSQLGEVLQISEFKKHKLPTNREVIGRIYDIVDKEINVSFPQAVSRIAQELYVHWTDRNVYPVSFKTIKNRVTQLLDGTSKDPGYRKVKSIAESKRHTPSYSSHCRRLNGILDNLFDIFCEDKDQRKKMETNHSEMQESDWEFLRAMRTPGQPAYCLQDDKLTQAELKRKCEQERRNAARLQRQNISFGTDDGCSLIEDEKEDDCDRFADDAPYEPTITSPSSFTSPSTRYTRRKSPTAMSTPQPSYVRASDRKVRDDIYHTYAELVGGGLSIREASFAMKTVAKLFGCNWVIPDEHASKYDQDAESETAQDDNSDMKYTLPTEKAIRSNLDLIHAYSLKLTADNVMKKKSEGAVVTHATDGTTRKTVGGFAVSGVHLDRDTVLPLPILNTSSETTDNVADGVITGINMLAAASSHTTESLYDCVDTHMTDATSHNKGLSKAIALKLDRDNPAGQLFCNVHTTLGFDRGIKDVIHDVETEMGLENIFLGFMLDIDLNQCKGTVSLEFLSWALNLFGPDWIQKPWNYNRDFKTHVAKNGNRNIHLFSLKDAHFGCLSKSAAVTLYHWNDFKSFLENQDTITNKLACLIRDAMAFDYIKTVLAVVAAFGVHLIEPFFIITKSKATHSELQSTFTDMYSGLKYDDIDERFFNFESSAMRGVSDKLIQELVKNEYTSEVASTCSLVASERMDDCISLANLISKKLASVLSMQRGKYYKFGEHEPEFSVFEQTQNVDRTVTNNIEMERQCGMADNRLRKKPRLETVSRDMILQKTQMLRDIDDDPSFFRKMTTVVEKIKGIKADWDSRQQELQQIGLSKRESEGLRIEQRKNAILRRLKDAGGPFTKASEVDDYIRDEVDEGAAQHRLRDEITFARDTSRSLPRTCPLFKIMTIDTSTGKRRMKSGLEFASSIKLLLGKQEKQTVISPNDFRDALSKL